MLLEFNTSHDDRWRRCGDAFGEISHGLDRVGLAGSAAATAARTTRPRGSKPHEMRLRARRRDAPLAA